MQKNTFSLQSPYLPAGDQPAAIEALLNGLEAGKKFQTLLGATGTGKTFTMANIIAKRQRPTLVISHNKTLAAQLYEELKELFPNNAVSYFVSYYDYYQPEAYIPQRDIYIEKDASRNDELDRLRLSATANLLSRSDCIIVASVSCIYGLGNPETYRRNIMGLRVGQNINRRDILQHLTLLQYKRSEDLERAHFRVRGDTIDVLPANENEHAIRIDMFGDEIVRLLLVNPLTGERIAEETQVLIFPAVQYMIEEDNLRQITKDIRKELRAQSKKFEQENKLLEQQRIEARVNHDIEQILELGYCSGVENYSRYFDGRKIGESPYTLFDYLAACRDDKDYLVLIDESHVTLPQMRAMYNGDKARKSNLVDHGFRLPCALDNRPLKFDEILEKLSPCVFVSATPGPFELESTHGEVTEQLIRPTGLLDPEVFVRPAQGQVKDVIEAAQKTVAKGGRCLLTTLTKRMAEDLSEYLEEYGIRSKYMHSDIDTLERVEILRQLRTGDFDVLVGVNLLREGLDLPEVSFVGILDADKEGFLRNHTSLIQTIGRAARNANAYVVLYGDKITGSMQSAIDETKRRRSIQEAYNEANNITPQTIQKAIRDGIEKELQASRTAKSYGKVAEEQANYSPEKRGQRIKQLKAAMLVAAEALEFEKAADLRDQIATLEKMNSN